MPIFRNILKERGLTVSDACAITGLSRDAIYSYIHGSRSPNDSIIKIIMGKLKTKPYTVSIDGKETKVEAVNAIDAIEQVGVPDKAKSVSVICGDKPKGKSKK